MKIKLETVLEAMWFANDESTAIYYPTDGQVYYIWDGTIINHEEDEELKEALDWEGIRLPDTYDINEYAMMEEFIWSLEDPEVQNRLNAAIRGRGAFRYFKAEAECLGLLENWYAFRDATYERIAKEWCQEHEIVLEE